MTQEEYYQYLVKTLKMDFLDQNPKDHSAYTDNLFGMFQSFMPNGEGVEKVFEPFPRKEEYLQRIEGVFTSTKNSVSQTLSEGMVPAYFVPRTAVISEAELVKMGEALIATFKTFAEHIGHEEMLEILDKTKSVRVVDTDIRTSESEEHEIISDVILEWTQENRDYDEPVEILSEAYYSIACDYWLADYLQYPRFSDKPPVDFLEPYFTLWKNGYHCWFYPGELLISNK